MTKDECIGQGKRLLERAQQKKNAGFAFRASYYFFWAEEFEPAKKALEAAYALEKEKTPRKESDAAENPRSVGHPMGCCNLPSACNTVSGLMDGRTHSKLVHSFGMGLEGLLREPGSRLRDENIESALRRGGFWDEGLRRLVLEYLDFDVAVFLMAYSLSGS